MTGKNSAQWDRALWITAERIAFDGHYQWFADVVGAPGAWGGGPTRAAALADARDVLTEWTRLKTEDGDDDLPWVSRWTCTA